MKKEIKDEIISRIDRIPSLSPAASRLVTLTSDPNYDVNDIVDIVMCDATLTARLLRIVNSPVFGLRIPIDNIYRAVIYLGPKLVAGIAIGESAPKLFKSQLTGYETEPGGLWSHILFSAIAAREIAPFSKVGEIDQGQAFTAGILHDIGKAVISDLLENTSKEIVGNIERGDAGTYVDAEVEKIGITHAEAGFLVAEKWNLPESLKQSILHHHSPSSAPEEHRALSFAVHIGDILSMQWGCGTGADDLKYALDQSFDDYFSFTEEDQAMIVLSATEEHKKLREAMLEG